MAALLSLAWTFTTAPLQGPDEPQHFSYAQYLAETGHRPSISTGDLPDSTQTGTARGFLNLQQLAGDRAARPAWSHLEERRFNEFVAGLGAKAAKDGSGPNALAKNPPLYYAYEAIPYRIGSLGSYWDRLVLMRLGSGLLFLLTVLFTWLAAAEVFAATWPRVIAAGCVALLPGLTAISGAINADNMLIVVWAAFAFAALQMVRRGPSLGRTVAVCAIAGLSLVTHGRGTAIVVPLAAVLAIAFLRARPPWRQTARWLGAGIGLLAAIALAYVAFIGSTGGAYGGEIRTGPVAMRPLQLISWTWQFYFPRLPFMDLRNGPAYGYRQVFIESFFGRFGSLEVGWGAPVYTLLKGATTLGLLGLVAAIVTRWSAIRANWPTAVVLVAMTLGMLALLHTASYRALLSGVDPLITGRYLYPLVPIFGCTVAFVLTSVRPRTSAVLGGLTLGGLLALNLTGLMLTMARFYG